MCDPVTMLVTGGIKAYGAHQKGQAEKRSKYADAREHEYQAMVERSNAQAEAYNIRQAGAQARGETLAGIAASGVEIGEGSALDAERDVMQRASRDEYMAILSGDRNADALERQARSLRQAGRDAARAGNLKGFGSLLSAGYEYGKATGWKGLKGWDAAGFNGTNDRSRLSFGSSQDWHTRNGRGGD